MDATGPSYQTEISVQRELFKFHWQRARIFRHLDRQRSADDCHLGIYSAWAKAGSIPRHIVFPGGGDFETHDNDGVGRLVERHLGRRGIVHHLEAHRPRLVLFVAATLVLAVAIYRYAVPLLVEVAIWATPPAVTDLIDRGAMSSLDQLVLDETKLSEDAGLLSKLQLRPIENLR